MLETKESKRPHEIGRLVELAYPVVILGFCYWAKDFLLPIVLAALITFLTAPLVCRLERWGFHSIVAVFAVVAVAFALLGAVCTTVSIETLSLVNSLPKYRDNIRARWEVFQKEPPGPVNAAFRNVGELIADLSKSGSPEETLRQQSEPTKVQIVGGTGDMLTMVRTGMTPVLAPAASFAVVVVLVAFMLFERKHLRERFLRIIGKSHVVTSALAVDEAGSRLSRFLLVQLEVNTGFAVAVGVGLYLIGIPNAMLWAILALVLRFLPYVGIWISAFFPLALSIAISTSWKEPCLTVLLYGSLELFTNNVIEPIVLGGSTGVSSLAVIVSALFWTWLWGPVGLLLATPLTACLVVLGLYFPTFHFWSVLLASDPPTTTEANLIRLLTENRVAEAKAMVHEATGMDLSLATAENLIVPTIRMIENGRFPGGSNTQSKRRTYEQMREIIGELKINPREAGEEEADRSKVFIVPFTAEGDELVGWILTRLLEVEGVSAEVLSWRALRSEKIEELQEMRPRWILLSAIEARAALGIGKMARSIKMVLPETVILIGLWSLPPQGGARVIRKISESSVGGVYTSMEQAVRGIASLVSTASQETLQGEKWDGTKAVPRSPLSE
jgi:predicted PurR-regulated permease PerM